MEWKASYARDCSTKTLFWKYIVAKAQIFLRNEQYGISFWQSKQDPSRHQNPLIHRVNRQLIIRNHRRPILAKGRKNSRHVLGGRFSPRSQTCSDGPLDLTNPSYPSRLLYACGSWTRHKSRTTVVVVDCIAR
jgi:hypothetical protein